MTQTSFSHPDEWLLGSGATTHMTNNSSHLFNVRNSDSSIIIGDGTSLKAKSTGDMYLSIDQSIIKLTNVIFVPSISKNLLSSNRLQLDNTITITSKSLTIASKTGHTIVVKKFSNDNSMFTVRLTRLSPPSYSQMAKSHSYCTAATSTSS